MGRQKRHTGFLKHNKENFKRFKEELDAENEEIKRNYNQLDRSIYELANDDNIVSALYSLGFSLFLY